MKGRGLLTAAAAIQLVGAGFMLLDAVLAFAMPTAWTSPDRGTAPAMRVAGLGHLLLAGFTTWISLALLRRRRWAWVVSLVLSSAVSALMLAGIVEAMARGGPAAPPGALGPGRGRALLISILAFPVFGVIGLLVAGRHALPPRSDRPGSRPADPPGA